MSGSNLQEWWMSSKDHYIKVARDVEADDIKGALQLHRRHEMVQVIRSAPKRELCYECTSIALFIALLADWHDSRNSLFKPLWEDARQIRVQLHPDQQQEESWLHELGFVTCEWSARQSNVIQLDYFLTDRR